MHIAFSQFETGVFIKARFSKKTNTGLWIGHCENIQKELSRPDKKAFVKAVKGYQPPIALAHKPSNAFTVVPTLKSRKSRKAAGPRDESEESAGGSASGGVRSEPEESE